MNKEQSEYYSYVYRITNTKENKHYYGSRVCKMSSRESLNALEDLKLYGSSSSDTEFKKLLLTKKHIFKYKIVRTFNNKNDAIKFESLLHKRFNVGENHNFYNKANQKLNGFDFQKRINCKWCGASVNLSNINRFHNDNCLKNPNRDINDIKLSRQFVKPRAKISSKTKARISAATKGRKPFINVITGSKILAQPENLQKFLNKKFKHKLDLDIKNWKINKKPKKKKMLLLEKDAMYLINFDFIYLIKCLI